MSFAIESTGDIEIVCKNHRVSVADTVPLVFRTHGLIDPPFVVEIKSPSGQTIVSVTTRDLPSGEPQSAPPIEFVPLIEGVYTVEIKQVRGSQRGQARLTVSR